MNLYEKIWSDIIRKIAGSIESISIKVEQS